MRLTFFHARGVTAYFYYLFILSSLVSFYIFYLNNCGVWDFVLCVSIY